MDISEPIRLFNTVRYLKAKQIYYRLYYTLSKKIKSALEIRPAYRIEVSGTPLKLHKSVVPESSYSGEKEFTFLNLSKRFENEIDWNFPGYGKLWTYNLNYFDFLMQEDMSRETGIELIKEFISDIENIKDGLEPFPISLRGINWIKFISKHKIEDREIDASLRAQYEILKKHPEYHLLGNHLLENGFSLLFGAFYFRDEKLYKKAKEILEGELEEQILEDGAHFELSPMYHQIMLYRVLDCINLLKHNDFGKGGLLELFIQKASVMLGWLENMKLPDGSIPLLNDSALKIAPTVKQLEEYANSLGVEPLRKPLGDSGYRVFEKGRYTIVVDIGRIGPDYIPGHAHSDTFSFVLYVDGKPLIVDTGTSTYETNERRFIERSTAAHNTVVLDGLEQSEVWGGFRVARRAYVHDRVESENFIRASHDGYRSRLNAIHEREFVFNENSIKISDRIVSDRPHDARFYLHFHPDADPALIEGTIVCSNAVLSVKSADIGLSDYFYAPEFNRVEKAVVAELSFKKEMEIEIIL